MKRGFTSYVLISFKMSGIEDVAKNWLVDPVWQKVFKHTVDVFEDYVSYVLVSTYFKFSIFFFIVFKRDELGKNNFLPLSLSKKLS